MPKQNLRQNILPIVLVMIFAIIAMAPAYFNGVPSGNDQSQHYQFAWTVFQSISVGDIYPSYSAETNHGFGDFGLRFYPPLTYFLLALAYAITQDWYFASLFAFTLVFFVGGVGVFLWTRLEFATPQAIIAAMLYVFAPYHLNEIYNNFLLAEFFATAIIPFCFLFLTKTCRDGRWYDMAGLSVAYSLLILTHLPLTIIGSMSMGIYALVFLKRAKLWPTLAKLITAVFGSIVMTAFYWSRWLPELDWIAHSSPKYFGTTWDYRTNFLLLPDHFLKFGEDALNLWFADILLVSTLLVVIPTAVYLIRDKALFTRFVTALTVVLGFSVLMATPVSSVVWNSLGFLQKVQFPWRFLTIITAFAAILSAVGIIRASEAMKAGGKPFLTIGLAMVLFVFFFTTAFVTRGSVYVSREQLNRQMTTVEGSESCDCWWPVWARRAAFDQTDSVSQTGRRTDIKTWTAVDKQFHVAAGEPVRAALKIFYYPHWHAAINGTPVPVGIGPSGEAMIELPAEQSDIKLDFREPAYVAVANLASASAWLLLLVITLFLLIKSRKVPPAAADPSTH